MNEAYVYNGPAGSRASVFPLETRNGIELLQIADILFAEVYEHKTSLFLKGGRQVQGFISLTEIEKKLTDYGFFRCHRSYLVSFLAVSRIKAYELKLVNGVSIPISKYKYKEFLSAYSRYTGVII